MSETIQDKLVVKKTLTLKEASEILSEYIARKYSDRLIDGKYKTSVEFTFENKGCKEDGIKEISANIPFVVIEVLTRKN